MTLTKETIPVQHRVETASEPAVFNTHSCTSEKQRARMFFKNCLSKIKGFWKGWTCKDDHKQIIFVELTSSVPSLCCRNVLGRFMYVIFLNAEGLLPNLPSTVTRSPVTHNCWHQDLSSQSQFQELYQVPWFFWWCSWLLLGKEFKRHSPDQSSSLLWLNLGSKISSLMVYLSYKPT